MFTSFFNQDLNGNLNANLLNDESFYPNPFQYDNTPNDLSLSRSNNLINLSNYEMENLETIKKPITKPHNEIINNKGEADKPLNFNIFTQLSQQNLPLPIYEKEIKSNDEKENTNKSTGDKTKENEIVPQKIFGVKDKKIIESRVDYAIKNIKVQISQFLKDYGNELIKRCNFQNKLKKLKLFSPSYVYFTGNSNEKDNHIFINFTMEKVLSYPEEKINNKSNKDNRLQRQNKEIIKQFKDYIEEKYPDEVPEQFQNLLNFFRMTYEDIIILFYNSEHFKNYCSSQKAEQYNEQFIKTKGYSLLDKNGFIKLMKKK